MAAEQNDIPAAPGTLDPDALPWHHELSKADLGVDLVALTPAKKRVVFRALNITALLIELGAEWVAIDQDADEVRRLAREVLPEGIGAE